MLLITGEYSTGMIRASLTVVPKRLPMLWAKLGVFAGVVFLTMLLASGTAFFVGQALLSGNGLNGSLSDPGALRSVVGAALYLTVAGMTALAIGALLRNTAAAVTTFVAVFFVIPPLTNLLPTSWTDQFAQYLPSNAGAVHARRIVRCRPSAGPVDRIRGDVLVRRGPHRGRRLAAAPGGRLTHGHRWGLARPVTVSNKGL